PIQRLPIELLQEIFLVCLPAAEYMAPSSRLAPMLISWVCKHWRNTAHSLPALW
ncbi:hypothetical protein B0H10DRAFT_1712997, partial [Mycena sp. CBHHK59/15]